MTKRKIYEPSSPVHRPVHYSSPVCIYVRILGLNIFTKEIKWVKERQNNYCRQKYVKLYTGWGGAYQQYQTNAKYFAEVNAQQMYQRTYAVLTMSL